ncbi:MAG: hypothetical protein QG640_630 [Patescibacteria group bacterium]|nr:hypothetical protein [Patescibacteria group bacterium]
MSKNNTPKVKLPQSVYIILACTLISNLIATYFIVKYIVLGQA